MIFIWGIFIHFLYSNVINNFNVGIKKNFDKL
jgi:hypothetical protein